MLNYVVITFIPNSDVFHFYGEFYVSCELWLLNQYDLGCMLVGLKSFVISRNLELYGLKFVKLTASVEDFSYLISYNYVDPLQLTSEHGLACYCSHGYLKTKLCFQLSL
jgi:hypothetical protein